MAYVQFSCLDRGAGDGVAHNAVGEGVGGENNRAEQDDGEVGDGDGEEDDDDGEEV
jgi:hypothetical protein